MIDLLDFLVIFKGETLRWPVLRKRCLTRTLADEQFVFGDVSTVENKENSGSLDSLVLSHQGERTNYNALLLRVEFR